jgi:hypothetical protein
MPDLRGASHRLFSDRSGPIDCAQGPQHQSKICGDCNADILSKTQPLIAVTPRIEDAQRAFDKRTRRAEIAGEMLRRAVET